MMFNLLLFTLLGVALAWPIWGLARWWNRRVRVYHPQGPMGWITPYFSPAERARADQKGSA